MKNIGEINMVLRIITLLCCLAFSLLASAQASGGQIRRPAKKQPSNAANRTVKPSKNVNKQRPLPLTGIAPSHVAVGEQFRLSYTVNTNDVKDFGIGDIPDAFDVLMGPSRTSTTSQSGNRLTFTYILSATKNGSFTIPAAHATVEGKIVTSNELHIKVSGQAMSGRNGQRVNSEEKQMIIKVFTTYFNALARMDEAALSSTLSPVLNSFLHRANATKADVVLYMQKLHEPDITRMEFNLNNDWEIEKNEQGIERYSYMVTFTVAQHIKRTEEGYVESTAYKVTAQVSPEGRITELNMKRWAPASSDGQNQESYSLSTSKGCYEQAKKLRMEGNGRQAIDLCLKANGIGESPYKTWALHQIGCIYYLGLGGVKSNYYEAYKYFKMASDSGFLPSTYYLGVCYEYGRGVGKDVSKANYYYTKSGYSKAPGYDF